MFKAIAIFHMLFFGQPVDVVYDLPTPTYLEPLDTQAKCLAFAASKPVLSRLELWIVFNFRNASRQEIQQIEPACVLVTSGA